MNNVRGPRRHMRLSARARHAPVPPAGTEVTPHHRVRFAVLFGIACLGFGAIVFRLICLQVWWSKAYAEIAHEQHNSKLKIEARRGTIYDRRGQVLATTMRGHALFANPPEVDDPAAAALALAPYAQQSARWIYGKLTANTNFVYLRRRLPEGFAEPVTALGLAGIGLEEKERRYYPNDRLAATLLGFAGVDNQGLDGIEYHYDGRLRGVAGSRITTRDVYGRSLPALTHLHTAPQPGAELHLTIDQVVQYHTTQVLNRVRREQRAQSATAVVLEPRTGAILAMVSLPDFNPNEYGAARKGHRRNRAVTDTFEPGSVFKIVPAVATLDAGLVQAQTPVYCEDGWYRYYGHVIHDTSPLGSVTFAQVLAQSSNIGIVKVANLLTPEALHRQITLFGFGRRTGIGLPGEASGLYRPPAQWSKLSMGALPIGQEIGVTALQLAVAYGALANDGVRMRPYTVAEVRDHRGKLLERTEPQEVARVCAPETARTMRRLLAGVVAGGTGHRAAVPGYSVAGKTGTAQKTDPRTGRYSKEDYIAVFVGMVPATRPAFVLVVVLDSPRGQIWGGKVAAPAFRDIAIDLVQYLEIPPDLPLADDEGPPVVLAAHPAEEPLLPPETYLGAGQMPDLTGRTMREVLALLAPYPVRVALQGSGLVTRQNPPAGDPLLPDMTCVVVCAPASA